MPALSADRSGYRGRFAPSPTGPLHLGSLTAALGSWLLAKSRGGKWLLRIEDIDPPRERPGVARQQIGTLAAFGLRPDEPVLWQSERSAFYQQALQSLIGKNLAFACHCSRSDLAPFDGVHRQCVARPSGKAAAYRLRLPERTLDFEDRYRGRFSQALRENVGDVVLKRADGFWAYQLAVVVDDAAQSITEVVRGADLLDSTPRQILLQQMLGLPTPAYAHLPIIRSPGGGKLSKSVSSAPVDPADPLPALRLALRFLGQEAATIDGCNDVEAALARALRTFDPDRIPRQDTVFPS